MSFKFYSRGDINILLLRKFLCSLVISILIIEGSIYILLKKNSFQIHYIIQEEKFENSEMMEESYVWKIEIPIIDLCAEIVDGIEDEVLNCYVGHFPTTGYYKSNIALAAHNRGYPVNYFENIKYLEYGDEIFYYYHNIELKFIVLDLKIIKDTQVEVLENTNDDIITLITCVENEPEYRRCVIGVKVS